MPKRLLILLIALILVAAAFAGLQYYVQSKVPAPVEPSLAVSFTQYLAKLQGTEIPDETARKYLKELGIETLMSELISARPHCHSEAHAVGRMLYSETNDLGTAVMQCGRQCTDGCFHGAVMGLFGDSGTHTHDKNEAPHDPHPVMTDENRDDIIKTLLSLCDDTSIVTITNGRRGDCAHAVGHAALFVTGYDTPSAIALCKQFKEPDEQYFCVTGIYMERNSANPEIDNAVSIYSPCENETEFPAACYRYELQEIYDKNLASQEDVLAYCQSLNDPAQQQGCFHGYGFAYHYSVQTNLPTIKSLCQYGDTIAQELCVEGAIGAAGNQVPEIIAEACTYLPDYLKPACLTGVREHSFGSNRDFSRYVNKE